MRNFLGQNLAQGDGPQNKKQPPTALERLHSLKEEARWLNACYFTCTDARKQLTIDTQRLSAPNPLNRVRAAPSEGVHV